MILLNEISEMIICTFNIQKEEEEHAKTKNNLAMESEQLEFALGEIDVLSKQLEREKQAFDTAYGCQLVGKVFAKTAGL